MIKINDNMCIGCGLCAKDCFPGALEVQNGTAVLANLERCIGCGHCIAVCPQSAVTEDSVPMDDVSPVRMEITGTDLLDLMRSRRSCRHFRKEPVPESVWRQMIQAARACPTAKNLQATRYIVVTEKIPQLLDLALETLGALGKQQLKTATLPGEIRRAGNFVRWAEQRKDNRDFDPLFFHAPMLLLLVSPEEAALDAASGAAYAELMAASLGLGCLYSGYFAACVAASEGIRNVLGIREGERLVRCLVLGYPDIRFLRTAPRKEPQISLM